MKVVFFYRWGVIGAIAAFAGGCASLPFGGPLPKDGEDMRVCVKADKRGLSMGAYRIPDSSFILLDACPESSVGPLLGTLAHAIQDQLKKAARQSNVRGVEEFYCVNLVSVVGVEFASAHGFEVVENELGGSGNRLIVIPYANLWVRQDKTVYIEMVLDAEVRNPAGRRVWRNTVSYYSDEVKPLDADKGWAAAEGSLLRAFIADATRWCVGALVDEVETGAESKLVWLCHNSAYFERPTAYASEARLISMDGERCVFEFTKRGQSQGLVNAPSKAIMQWVDNAWRPMGVEPDVE